MATQLPDLVARYVVAWCDVLTKLASVSRSPRHAEALCALLRGLGRLFVPGVDLDALRAPAAPQNDRNQRTPQPCSGDALLAESVSRLRTSDSGASTEAAADAQQALAATEQRLVTVAAALPPPETGAALREALHASGRFQLLADSLLTGAAGATSVSCIQIKQGAPLHQRTSCRAERECHAVQLEAAVKACQVICSGA